MNSTTYTVAEAISCSHERWLEFRDEPQRVTGELAAHAFGACLFDTNNRKKCIHIPGSWIYRALPDGPNSGIGGGIGGYASYVGLGAVTATIGLGGLCGASLTMSNIQSFELDEEPDRIFNGPFTDLDEIEILGRFGRDNAIARWPGNTTGFMVTLDETTLRTMTTCIERIGDPEFDDRNPAERARGFFRLYASAAEEIMAKYSPNAG